MTAAELRGASKPSLDEALGWVGSRVDDIYGAGVGRLEDVWIDPGTGMPRWLLVKEGRFGGRTTLIPFEDATAGAGHVWIPYERDVVRDAPQVQAGAPLTKQLESALREHYAAGSSEEEDQARRSYTEATHSGSATGLRHAMAAGDRRAPRSRSLCRSPPPPRRRACAIPQHTTPCHRNRPQRSAPRCTREAATDGPRDDIDHAHREELRRQYVPETQRSPRPVYSQPAPPPQPRPPAPSYSSRRPLRLSRRRRLSGTRRTSHRRSNR